MNKLSEAFNLMFNYLVSEGIYPEPHELLTPLNKWNDRLPNLSPKELAAVSLANPYESQLTKQEIRDFKTWFFGSEN